MSALFRAMGTTWWVDCDRPHLLRGVARLVDDVEDRLSRFREHSAVRSLGRRRSVVDPLLANVVRRALAFERQTEGAFAITLGAELSGWGYAHGAIPWADELAEVVPVLPSGPIPGERTIVTVDGDQVSLRGPGELDLGGIAKGWTVDLVHDTLISEGCRWVWVDGGGDLRASGRPMPVGVPGDRAVLLDGGVATSGTGRRRWRLPDGRLAHHLLDPRTRSPAPTALRTATVLAPDATTADVWATALMVRPTLVDRVPGEALFTDPAGASWLTSGWPDVLEAAPSEATPLEAT